MLAMIHPEPLTEKNWILYAAKHYSNPSCHDVKEFFEDIKRFKYIKKAHTKYETSGAISDHSCRLVLNHIVILNNVFNPETLARLVFLRLDKQLSFVKPFMIFLNIWPESVVNIGEVNQIYTDVIVMDKNIIDFLRRI